MQELKAVRNFHGAFHYGVGPGMVHAGLVSFVTRGAEPWSLRNRKKDCERTGLAKDHSPIEYPKVGVGEGGVEVDVDGRETQFKL